MKSKTLSIIIVNYKVKNELFACIESIYNSSPKISFEIIVVDNDEKKTVGQGLINEFKHVKYIKSEKNLGFGGGNNLGASHAQGEYLFFLNPDTIILDGALDSLHSFFIKNKNIGIISPFFVDSNLKPFRSHGSEELTPRNILFSQSLLRKIFPIRNIYSENSLPDWNMEFPRETNTVPGAAMMIKSSIFKKIGGFDRNFFLYFEENDISKRIKKLGYRLYIVPSAKIVHLIGKSTKHFKNVEDIYSKSRYLYLKKHYGLFAAIIVNILTSINKNHILMFLILLLGTFLRFYKLNEFMTFIGDQGWFYLSARDILLTGKIPLVGITSSHTWLHQGPLWTYIIAIIFWIFNFNPIAPAYFTGALGIFTIYLFYKLIGEIFSKNTGLFAAALYATSPLIVINDRFAYHTTLIPFFTLLFIYFFYKWSLGKIIYLPLTFFILSILYNLELFTSVLYLVLIITILLGYFKKRMWIKRINKKITFLAVTFLILPMIPVIIYDYKNGFHQTILFPAWIFYKSILFVFNFFVGNIHNNLPQLIQYLWTNYQNFIDPLSGQISLLFLVGSISYLLINLYKTKSEFNNFIAFTFAVLIFGVIINRTSSGAYLPIFFPFIILVVSIFLARLIRINGMNFVVLFFFLVVISFNSMYLIATNFFSNKNFSFAKRIESVDKIINLVKNQKYNILGKGEGSQFESFTMNYKYLLWWKGYSPSQNQEKLKIIFSESSNGIKIEKMK